MEYIRWIGLIFIPFILVIRHLAKKKEHPKSLRVMLVAFFFTFVAWMALMLKTNQLS